MARIPLTDAQKDLLYYDGSFRSEVKWAILNKAAYQVGLNGVGLVDAPSATQWRKYMNLALSINQNPSVADADQNIKMFLIYFKGVLCADSQSFTVADTVAFLLNDGNNYNNFDAAAGKWFDSQVAVML